MEERGVVRLDCWSFSSPQHISPEASNTTPHYGGPVYIQPSSDPLRGQPAGPRLRRGRQVIGCESPQEAEEEAPRPGCALVWVHKRRPQTPDALHSSVGRPLHSSVVWGVHYTTHLPPSTVKCICPLHIHTHMYLCFHLP